jgi:hypothetical protein
MCNGVQEDTRRHTVEEEDEEEEEKGSRRRRKERERQKKGYLSRFHFFVLSFSSSLEILRNPKN